MSHSVSPALGDESFADMFEQTTLETPEIKEGSIVKGTVVDIIGDYAVVDVGLKAEGQVPLREFREEDESVEGGLTEPMVNIGDEVEVLLETAEDQNGLVILSKEKARKRKVWDEISKAVEHDGLVTGTITARVKGGLAVVLAGGVKAFLPGSQVDLRPVRNLDAFIAQDFEFKIIKFNKKRGNIVLSRRVLLEAERAEMKEETLGKLQEGQIVEGVVKNLTDYGAFIDLGGIDGLLHITDMSWGRVNHPSELFQVGDKVQVKVLKFNTDSERVSLGLKQITPDPWINAEEKYIPGTVVQGKVVSIKDYGAFIELEEGIEGLVHVSEMSWTRQIKNPKQILKIGDEVKAVVLDIDVSQNRISLGMKQLEENPYEKVVEKYPPGTVVQGIIRNIADFGVFVELEPGIDGLVHITDLSWTQRVRHPSELFKKGDEVQAMVLNIDNSGEKPKISLGIKQLQQDPWDRIPYDYPIGKIIEVKILKLAEFGAFAEIEPGIEGLVHISEITDERIEDPAQVLEPGQVQRAEVIQMDAAERRIGLSIKSARRQDELADAQGFQNASQAGATLGDLMSDKLRQATSGKD
ncbi:30S ribosomal protein S1 [Paraliomyxa miuraensis]|uniref:30S ribosomal protein S1 n=1 Tax=Paraliomyxa miuraensis TaxID=376150 RepID=UPI0022559813|nr:30S ribosomal protein S1 [Paraliomyxa miuraensis]MCX4245795.1 30S ribosomal protein S1 [Paraliomyxa miuraensis]